MTRQCRQCGAEVKRVVGPGSIQDVRCSDCGVGGAILPDGRLTGPAFVRSTRGGLIIGGNQ